MNHKTPTLIPLDMSLAQKHEHPDIQKGKKYLCLIGNEYFAGRFSRVWFGWTFRGWYNPHLQFDAPGFNSSRWQQIWEIKEE